MKDLVVVAFGGNASYPPSIRGSAEEQLQLMHQACRHLAAIMRSGYRLLVTHGNGPVVGNILFRMARSAKELPPMPMDICVAHSQGGMGYMLQQTLGNVLRDEGMNSAVASVLTQVEVDAGDAAFADYVILVNYAYRFGGPEPPPEPEHPDEVPEPGTGSIFDDLR